jgi:hypothetical protein
MDLMCVENKVSAGESPLVCPLVAFVSEGLPKYRQIAHHIGFYVIGEIPQQHLLQFEDPDALASVNLSVSSKQKTILETKVPRELR